MHSSALPQLPLSQPFYLSCVATPPLSVSVWAWSLTRAWSLLCGWNHAGKPTEESTHWIQSEKSRSYLLSLPPSPKANFAKKYPGATPDAIDLLTRLLALNPMERMTAEDALTHPYFAEYHDPEDEPVADNAFSFEYELDDLPHDRLRDLILEQITDFVPPAPE